MDRVNPRALCMAALLLLASAACARPTPPAPTAAPAATSPAITPDDLRRRLEAFAHDSMLGRRSGELGGHKAAEFLAAEARRLGLEPAGEDGSFFQTVPAVRRTLEPGASSPWMGPRSGPGTT